MRLAVSVFALTLISGVALSQDGPASSTQANAGQESNDKLKDSNAVALPAAPSVSRQLSDQELLEKSLREAAAQIDNYPPADLWINPETDQWEHRADPKYRVFDKTFISVHSAYLASIVFDVEITHQGLAHHKCVEGNGETEHPSRGELYGWDLAFLGVAFTMDTVVKYGFRDLSGKLFSTGLPISLTVPHVHGGVQWLERCW
jgi:hypothetical protein